jgi:ribosomal protein S6--L-glutamate ligase
MGIVVITARPEVGSVARLVEAAAARSVQLDIVNALDSVAKTGPGGAEVLSPGRAPAATGTGCVLARIGNWRPDSLLSLLEAYEEAGVPSPNPASAIRHGRDHWATVRRVAAAGLPVPATLVGADPERLAGAAAAEIGFPLVVKTRRSRMGVGVVRCVARDHLDAVLDSLWRVGEEMIVQRFIGTPGRSIRALVVDGRVVAAAEFRASGSEWRSNGARGAEASEVALDDAHQRLAAEAADAVGLGIAGVDLLESADGPVVCEVNPTPGFVRLEQATSVDVAGAIVHALDRRCRS